MASKFATVKLNSRLVDEARREAELFHRSLGSQIEHRAKIGRALENADGSSVSRVRAALEGRLTMDDLSAIEQDAFFSEIGTVFEAPSSEVGAAYAELGEKRQGGASGARGADQDSAFQVRLLKLTR